MWSRIESRGLLGERSQVRTRFEHPMPHKRFLEKDLCKEEKAEKTIKKRNRKEDKEEEEERRDGKEEERRHYSCKAANGQVKRS